jgi:phosphate/sulfate permease
MMKDAQLLDQMMRCNHALVIGAFAITSGLLTLWSHFQHTVGEQALPQGLLIGIFSLSVGAFAFGLAHYTKLKAQKQLETPYYDKRWTGIRNEY